MSERDPVGAEAVERVRRALQEDPPGSQWAQLATASREGVARVRTVVLHDVTDDARLVVATDAASAKVADLEHEPRAEVCLLARRALEQFRLRARFEVVDATRAARDAGLAARRRALWKAMPPREKGYYISPPGGLDLGPFSPDAFHAEAHEPNPVERFCLLLGELVAIDVLDVSVTPHRRVVYERGGDGRFAKRPLTP